MSAEMKQKSETYMVVLPIRDLELFALGIAYIKGMSEDQLRRYFKGVQGLKPEEIDEEISFVEQGGGRTQGFAEGSMRTFKAVKKFAQDEKLSFDVTELEGRAAVLAAEGNLEGLAKISGGYDGLFGQSNRPL